MSHAKYEPTSRAIAWRAAASVNVLVIALMMPGVVNAFTQPSSPQTTGCPGRAV